MVFCRWTNGTLFRGLNYETFEAKNGQVSRGDPDAYWVFCPVFVHIVYYIDKMSNRLKPTGFCYTGILQVDASCRCKIDKQKKNWT